MSISYEVPGGSERTCVDTEPRPTFSCVVVSSRFITDRLVDSPSRTAVEPMCSSERAPASFHNWSPVVSGRFTAAYDQVSVPAGSVVTAPDR
ncbi:hypothetical protein BUB20358_04929 [Burkholderia ubonensis]|nr:hypothetical protein BUB20358_04929 [Burkholderia ubonensis]